MTVTNFFIFLFALFGADQPQWGERHTRNMVSEEKGLPENFNPKTGTRLKWTAHLGTQTHSTPVVAGGKVLIGTNNGAPRDPRHKGDRGILMCLDEKDGALLWQLVVPKIDDDPASDWPHTGIASPPTVEGDRAYLVSNRGEVLCIDLNGLANGNDGPYRDEGRHMAPQGASPMDPGPLDADLVWIFDMASQLGIYQHDAAHCSILLHGPFLYAATSNGVDGTHRRVVSPDSPSLIVLDKATGRLVARDGEGIGPRIIHCTWASPALGEVNGRALVFFGGGDGVCYAFEALEGAPPPPSPHVRGPEAAGPPAKLKKVWSFDCDPGAPKENVHKFQDNRAEGPSNIIGMPVFHRGRVFVTAGGDLWHGKTNCWLKCIDASKTGDITRTGELWSYPLKRHCLSTPSIRDGLVFIADCGRTVHCLDVVTGRPYWTQETQGEIWSSTLAADGKVYIGTRRGDFWILAAGKEKKVLASIDLDEPISSTAIAANGRLYVATMSQLYALGN